MPKYFGSCFLAAAIALEKPARAEMPVTALRNAAAIKILMVSLKQHQYYMIINDHKRWKVEKYMIASLRIEYELTVVEDLYLNDTTIE